MKLERYDEMKIGIFDSGIGGLSVLHLALKYLPEEKYIYYADEEHVPYGEKTKEQIITYVNDAVQFMLKQGVDAIVIACNTATSAAIEEVRSRYTIPIVGMEPAIKKAIDTYGDKRVLVAATPVTVRGEKMKCLMEKVDKEHLVDLVPLPKLVRYAEQGIFESDEVTQYLQEEFSAYKLEDYASLVLGCTHFNYFKSSFRKVLPEWIHFVDGNEGTVRRLMYDIEALNFMEMNETQSKLERTMKNEQENKTQSEYYYSGVKVTDQEELTRIHHYLQWLEKMLFLE